MQTSDLIARLVADARPVSTRAALARLATGLGVGAALALAGLLATFGTELAGAHHTSAFWMKWGYGLTVSAAALWLCLRLARPEPFAGSKLLWLALPLIVLAVAAIQELAVTAPDARLQVWLGQSAPLCPWIIGALSVPLFGGILWAFRRFAPTRPRLAGLAAGALAGAIAVVLYAIHCPETAVSFVATWYTLGMLLPALFGWAFGARILRW